MRSACSPGGTAPVEISAARPRPQRARLGTNNGPERTPLLSAWPPAQASAMWPRVSAPASPNSAASAVAPMPKESRTRMMARRDMGLVYCNPLMNGRWNGDGLPGQADRRSDGIGGPCPGSAIRCMNGANRLLWPDFLAQAAEVAESHAVVDLVLSAQAPAAQLDQRDPDRPRVDRGNSPGLGGCARLYDRGRRQIDARPLQQIARAAERRHHVAEDLRRAPG